MVTGLIIEFPVLFHLKHETMAQRCFNVEPASETETILKSHIKSDQTGSPVFR